MTISLPSLPYPTTCEIPTISYTSSRKKGNPFLGRVSCVGHNREYPSQHTPPPYFQMPLPLLFAVVRWQRKLSQISPPQHAPSATLTQNWPSLSREEEGGGGGREGGIPYKSDRDSHCLPWGSKLQIFVSLKVFGNGKSLPIQVLLIGLAKRKLQKNVMIFWYGLLLNHTHIDLPWGFNDKFSTSIPLTFIRESPPGPISTQPQNNNIILFQQLPKNKFYYPFMNCKSTVSVTFHITYTNHKKNV